MAKMRLKMAKRSRQEGQDEAQEGQEEGQEHEDEAQEGQEEAQEGPEETQESQDEPPRGPRGGPRGPREGQDQAQERLHNFFAPLPDNLFILCAHLNYKISERATAGKLCVCVDSSLICHLGLALIIMVDCPTQLYL